MDKERDGDRGLEIDEGTDRRRGRKQQGKRRLLQRAEMSLSNGNGICQMSMQLIPGNLQVNDL